MLTKEKTINLSGRSIIDGVEVARFSAQVGTELDSQTNLSTYINDQAAYRKNLKAVRADADGFRDYVREQEDAVYSELTAGIDDRNQTATAEAEGSK